MKKMIVCGLLCTTLAVWAANPAVSLQEKIKKQITHSPVSRVEDLTLREQVGQTIMPRLFVGQQELFKEAVLKGEVTGFFIKTELAFAEDKELGGLSGTAIQEKLAQERQKLKKTIQDLQAWSKLSVHQIPLLFAVDYEGGNITSPIFMGLKPMPSNMLLGASQDPSVVSQAYDAQAKELLEVGANVIFGPVTDVNSNPENPIIMARSFGSDAVQVGKKAALAVQALQANRVPAFNKHFPGHGDTATDTHKTRTFTKLNLDDLMKNHIIAFEPSIQAGVKGIMSAHVAYKALDKGTNASFSPKVLKELLQNVLGFKGVIATDGLDMGAVNGLSVEEIVRRAYKAGNHLLLLTSPVSAPQDAPLYARRAAEYVLDTVSAVEHGGKNKKRNISRQEIQEAARKVLELKKWMGLLDGTPATYSGDTGFEKASRRAAEEGVTLVRSEGNVALTDKEQRICKIFFQTPIVSYATSQFGNHLAVNGKKVKHLIFTPRMTSGEEAIYQKRVQACIDNAQAVVIGTSGAPRVGAIRGQYNLVTAALERAQQSGKKAILISMVNPYDIPLYPQAKNVLALYGITNDTMQVAAEIVLGERKAKGKLPIAF